MRIRVLYFAAVRERVGRDEDLITLPAAATTETLRAALDDAHPVLRPLWRHLRLARNQQLVPGDVALADGDEIALIPPVAGGAGSRVLLSDAPLSLDTVVSAVTGPEHGGIVTFTGTVRRNGQQPNVARLEYEAYAPMVLRVFTELADEVEREWPGCKVAMHHRVGTLAVGEIAVVIAAAAPHRAEAFAACRAVIDRLKERAPIWKKEIGDDGAEWVGLGP